MDSSRWLFVHFSAGISSPHLSRKGSNPRHYPRHFIPGLSLPIFFFYFLHIFLPSLPLPWIPLPGIPLPWIRNGLREYAARRQQDSPGRSPYPLYIWDVLSTIHGFSSLLFLPSFRTCPGFLAGDSRIAYGGNTPHGQQDSLSSAEISSLSPAGEGKIHGIILGTPLSQTSFRFLPFSFSFFSFCRGVSLFRAKNIRTAGSRIQQAVSPFWQQGLPSVSSGNFLSFSYRIGE